MPLYNLIEIKYCQVIHILNSESMEEIFPLPVEASEWIMLHKKIQKLDR
jgi:hypothetical protein